MALCGVVLVSPEARRSWITNLPTKPLRPTSTGWTDAVHPASLHSAASSEYIPSSQGTVSSLIRDFGQHHDTWSQGHLHAEVQTHLPFLSRGQQCSCSASAGLCWFSAGLTKGTPGILSSEKLFVAILHFSKCSAGFCRTWLRCRLKCLCVSAASGALFFATKPLRQVLWAGKGMVRCPHQEAKLCLWGLPDVPPGYCPVDGVLSPSP